MILFINISFISFSQNNFSLKIDSTYNFSPHKIPDSEKKLKIPQMEKFFKLVMEDTTKYLPLLRDELNTDRHNPYFYYDGAHLLMLSSKSKSDLEIVAESFSKTNIKDLNPKNYVKLLTQLALKKIDVSKPALKILDDNKFSFYLSQHAMKFNQAYCLSYCLLPLKPEVYEDKLIELFRASNDVNTQKSIITTLWFTCSCKSDTFLKSLNSKNTLSKEVYKYAQKIMTYTSFDKSIAKNLTSEKIDLIKTNVFKRFSDEAIYELDLVTRINRSKLNCK